VVAGRTTGRFEWAERQIRKASRRVLFLLDSLVVLETLTGSILTNWPTTYSSVKTTRTVALPDRPDDMADVFHTFFGVAGLSLLDYLPVLVAPSY
jgi:prenyltransferase beta subunit